MSREGWIPVIISGLPPNFDYSALRLAFSGPWQAQSNQNATEVGADGDEEAAMPPPPQQGTAYTSTKGTPAVVDADFQWWGSVAPLGRFLLTRISPQGVELFCSNSTESTSSAPKRVVSFQGNAIQVTRFGTAPGAAEEAGKWVSEVASSVSAGTASSGKPPAREKKTFGGARSKEDNVPNKEKKQSTGDFQEGEGDVKQEPTSQPGFGAGRFQPKARADKKSKPTATAPTVVTPTLTIEEILADVPRAQQSQESKQTARKRIREDDEGEVDLSRQSTGTAPAKSSGAIPAPPLAVVPKPPKVKSIPGSDSCKFCGSNDHLSRRCPNK